MFALKYCEDMKRCLFSDTILLSDSSYIII